MMMLPSTTPILTPAKLHPTMSILARRMTGQRTKLPKIKRKCQGLEMTTTKLMLLMLPPAKPNPTPSNLARRMPCQRKKLTKRRHTALEMTTAKLTPSQGHPPRMVPVQRTQQQ